MYRDLSPRPWEPPSFDPPRPVAALPPPPPGPTADELEALYRSVSESAAAEGHAEGLERGLREGREAGLAAGRADGERAAFEAASARLEALADGLADALATLRALPDAIADPLAELAWRIAQRLAGGDVPGRAAFVSAVREALMRLPRPGEELFLRIRPQDGALWERVTGDPELAIRCAVIADVDVPPGHAYVEIDGARLDVGERARRALVRMALGLPLDDDRDVRPGSADGIRPDPAEGGRPGAADAAP
jgi:flagellar biosynthesis/type III secretory pathway protein FliH